MKKRTLAALLIIISFASCRKEIDNSSQLTTSNNEQITGSIIATPATNFDSLFTRFGNGWTGGDGASSHVLPDGRSMWLFGDSYLDTVYPDRTRPLIGFIHNTVVLTDRAGGFTTLYGGTKQAPLPYFVAAQPDQYYWPSASFINAAKTQMFVLMARISPTGEGGLFGFEVAGNDIAVLSLPDLTLQRIVPFSKGSFIDWSSATLENNDGYIYLYGVESTKFNKFIHVARTPAKNPLRTVTFYDGTNWVADSAKSARIQGGVSEQFSMFKYQKKFYLLSQGNLLSPSIYLWDAASPVGPFTGKRKVYTTPQSGNLITYNASAHPEFIKNNQLLVGYSINSTNFMDLYTNADNYRPYFVWISNWQ